MRGRETGSDDYGIGIDIGMDDRPLRIEFDDQREDGERYTSLSFGSDLREWNESAIRRRCWTR